MNGNPNNIMEIRCYSRKTALKSVAAYFNCSENMIRCFLKEDWEKRFENLKPDWFDEDNDELTHFDLFLYNRAKEKLHSDILRQSDVMKKIIIRVYWFHGTRCLKENCESFKEGIWPLQDMLPKIKNDLNKIATNIGISEKNENNPKYDNYKNRLQQKLRNNCDKGPCAVLNYDAVIHSEKYSYHKYIELPEAVRECAYILYGDNATEIITAYKKETVPVIVEIFEEYGYQDITKVSQYIGHIINYLLHLEHHKRPTMGCNTSHSWNGEKIPVEQISKLYYLNI